MKTCSRCILDETIPHIHFDSEGVCNYCHQHDDLCKQFPLGSKGEETINRLFSEAKSAKKPGVKYDCIVGLSGGADSTYALVETVKRGLIPLAVYLDNSWSSAIAVCNIKNAVERLNVDLHTVVLDWVEFRSLLRSFLKASVPDTDIPTDIAIKATLYNVAKKYNIPYIVTGTSFRTEGLIPKGWTYMDGRYITSVQSKFEGKSLKKYPNLTLFALLRNIFFNKLKAIPVLNYLEYDKDKVKERLAHEVGWQDYGGKHYESIFTRFNQSCILYHKFRIDKRRIEYAALVRDGQLSKKEATEIIEKAPLSDEQVQADINYVAKKLKFSREEMDQILALPLKSYKDYLTYEPFIEALRPLVNFVQRFVTRL